MKKDDLFNLQTYVYPELGSLHRLEQELYSQELFNTNVLGYWNALPPITIVEPDKLVVRIKNYIINDGATVVYWEDGTKTVVRLSKGDKFDKRVGLLIAYFQKHCGMSRTQANKFLDNLVVTENKKKKEKSHEQ